MLLYLVKGYLVMFVVVDDEKVLCVVLMDELLKMVIMCFGLMLCVVGIVEFGNCYVVLW